MLRNTKSIFFWCYYIHGFGCSIILTTSIISTILDRMSASSYSFTYVPPSVPSCNTELYVYCLFITIIPNSHTLEYYCYVVHLSLFVLLSILAHCNTPTMIFVNSFDAISDHRINQSHSSDDPNATSIYNMLKIIPSSSSIKSYTSIRYNPRNKLITNNNDYYANNWQTLSSDCKAKLVSPPLSLKPKPKLIKTTTFLEFPPLLPPTLERCN